MNKYYKAFIKIKNHKILNDNDFWGGPYVKLYDELPKELDIIKELVDKTKKMKPILKVHKGSYDPISFFHCPICDFNDVEDINYCPNCGQSLECVKHEKDNL
ncbi:MAG: hypothetical protein E7183_07795 [Erysipelotrichaceae bacterium]|nr:hypothetical protein [Erysipelotrichaceae bacterium]